MGSLRPMLAASMSDDPEVWEAELKALSYPILVSPKIDGIRWMKPPNEKAKSRSWKDLPNQMFQIFMDSHDFDWLDGEVIVGDDITLSGLFNKTQSAIMTRDSTASFSLWVFDSWREPNKAFQYRTRDAMEQVDNLKRMGYQNVNYVYHQLCTSPKEVLDLEVSALEGGYEGIMLRNPQAPYKYGRSTLKQQGLIKVKRFTDDEAIIEGFEALERNTNEQVRDAFGLAKRSSHRSGKVQDNLLGRLLVRHERFGDFAIGSGFDVETRMQIWENQAAYVGKKVTFKYQEHGTLEKPRMPIYKGIRSE